MAANDDTEEWRAIEGTSIEVSSRGRVRQYIEPRPATNGYMIVARAQLARAMGTGCTTIGVHQLVCWAFHGRRPTMEHVVRHLDGVKTNNVPGNLAWGTHADNAEDRRRHGTMPLGSVHRNSLLREEHVAELRYEYAKVAIKGRKRTKAPTGWTRRMADRFGVSTLHITAVVKGRCWRWLDDA